MDGFWYAVCLFSAGISAGISVALATGNSCAGIAAGFAVLSAISAITLDMPDTPKK